MRPDLSVIIPVIHEGNRINDALDRLGRQQGCAKMEIIVVDGDPAGSTIQCIKDTSVISLVSPPGRGVQMNQGAARASGRILLFLHCDTFLPENGLSGILKLMEKKQVQAGAFDLCIDKQGLLFRVIEKISSLRSRLTRIPYGDQAVFINQAYFSAIGRFRGIPIMEDVDLMRRIKKDRQPIGFLNTRVLTSARRWEKEGLVRCTLRNWLLLALFLCGVSPEQLSKFYRS